MVHRYKQGGLNIIIDTYSGSIHAVDEIAYDMIGEFETTPKEQLIEKCGGYDFNYCLERKTKKDLELCAYLYNEANGVMMECFTTKPGLQIYTGNGTGGFKGKRGYIKHCAVCLETQFYPNTPNCPEYPSCTLKAGEEYNHQTVYKFSVK